MEWKIAQPLKSYYEINVYIKNIIAVVKLKIKCLVKGGYSEHRHMNLTQQSQSLISAFLHKLQGDSHVYQVHKCHI